MEQDKRGDVSQLIPFTSQAARDAQRKGQEMKWCQKAVADQFKLNARTFIKIMGELPDISPLDVMKLAIHNALNDQDFEAAAKYASQLAEYQTPKLARTESTITTRTEDMSDEDLERIIAEEHL